MASIWNSREPLPRDWPSTTLATPKTARVDTLKGCVHLTEDFLFLAYQVQCHFLFKLVAAKVPQVKRHVR
jgi:hypothetical protein